jgi:SOS-response transcriptional repressor LexA
MESFGEILRRLRVGSGYSQLEVAENLTSMGEAVTNKAVSKWERGDTLPDVFHFMNMCRLYAVHDPYSVFMRGASLSELGWSRVSEYVSLLRRDPRFVLPVASGAPARVVRLYDLPASAGTGVFLSDVAYDELAADDDTPPDADYALHISGDSMTPSYLDGQIIFVREQNTLEPGEIGIFALNDDVYCKELGMGELVSHNPDYAPIPLHEYDSFYILGKVLS